MRKPNGKFDFDVWHFIIPSENSMYEKSNHDNHSMDENHLIDLIEIHAINPSVENIAQFSWEWKNYKENWIELAIVLFSNVIGSIEHFSRSH